MAMPTRINAALIESTNAWLIAWCKANGEIGRCFGRGSLLAPAPIAAT
jgi:hypothetical protein